MNPASRPFSLGGLFPLAPWSDREIPPFDPEREVELSREEIEDPTLTIKEFKESVLQPDEKSVAHGFTTDNGEPISRTRSALSSSPATCA
jgi:hypothetical protein